MNGHRLPQPKAYRSRLALFLLTLFAILPWAAGASVGVVADCLLVALYYALMRQVVKSFYDGIEVCEDYREQMIKSGQWSEEKEALYWDMMRMTHGHDMVDAIFKADEALEKPDVDAHVPGLFR